MISQNKEILKSGITMFAYSVFLYICLENNMLECKFSAPGLLNWMWYFIRYELFDLFSNGNDCIVRIHSMKFVPF